MNLYRLTIKANFSGSFSSKIARNNTQHVNFWTLIFECVDSTFTSIIHMALWKLNVAQEKMRIKSLFRVAHGVQDKDDQKESF